MEAIGELTAVQAPRRGAEALRDAPRLTAVARGARTLDCSIDAALALLQSSNGTAVTQAAMFGVAEASDFAGRVEDLSRAVDHLQLVAASTVDRARSEAAAGARTSAAKNGADAPAGWLTGWSAGAGNPAVSLSNATWNGSEGAEPSQKWVDDGYRNTTEFLRARLRISAAEARRRLALAADVLPRTGMAGQPLPAAKAELAAAVSAGEVASRAATIICLSLDRVRHVSPPEAVARMEQALTRTAVENDQDFLTRVAKRWTDALDQDGEEPSEQELRRRQGAYVRQARRGLHHLEIFATADQFEHLLTVMNAANNPRTGAASPSDGGGGPAGSPDTGVDAGAEAAFGDHADDAAREAPPDQRTRPQRLLDGLVGACKAALAAGNLPAAGGLRPQVMVTIDYRDLLERLGGANSGARAHGSNPGTLMFTGPVAAATVRKIACDADIIPVLLGGQGRILDIGRASRVFPPHIRKAITARDGGCAFPQCTIPAPWCEAHHIDYWSRGGSTGTGNGALLCSRHHHLIHKEQWTIQLRSGVPWFIPPLHIDPRQVPRRNRYFRLE
ncbi:MAG: DUF222 domain-containing protein [Arthrobacter sp.]